MSEGIYLSISSKDIMAFKFSGTLVEWQPNLRLGEELKRQFSIIIKSEEKAG